MPTSKTKIIIIPGIFKREVFLEKFKEKLNNPNVDVEIYVMQWLESGMYSTNEKILIEKIIEYSKTYKNIFIIGTSAGGSVAINLYTKLPIQISKIVCICSPLDDRGITLKIGELISDKFKDSLSDEMKNIKKLSSIQKKNILTFIPKYDELVPNQSMKIAGVKHIDVNSYEHLTSIGRVINENIDDILSFLDIH